MKQFKIIALVLACILLFAGCSLVSVDKERVGKQVVATVNGENIYRDEVDSILQSYGVDMDPQDEETLLQYESTANDILDYLVNNEVILQKAPELGFDLTDEEKQQNEADAKAMFADNKQSIRDQVEEDAKADPSIDVDVETEVRYAMFLEMTNISPDTYTEYLNENAMITATQEYMYDQRQLTEDEVKAWYDDTLAMQQSSESFTSQFVSNTQQGYINTYVPERIIAVKHVLLKYQDEELASEAYTLYSEGSKDEAFEMLQSEIDALMPTALDVQQRLKDGENIDDLIAEFGEDPGMEGNTVGYLVTETDNSYVDEFTEAALTLKNVGDISDPVVTYYGLHVLQNIKVYEEGVIPFEDIKEEIETSLLAAEQQTAYEETLAKWVEEADVVYYRERLTNGL